MAVSGGIVVLFFYHQQNPTVIDLSKKA